MQVKARKVGKTIVFARRMSIKMRAGASRNKIMAMSFLRRDQNEPVSSLCVADPVDDDH